MRDIPAAGLNARFLRHRSTLKAPVGLLRLPIPRYCAIHDVDFIGQMMMRLTFMCVCWGAGGEVGVWVRERVTGRWLGTRRSKTIGHAC
jgi:hypothetical protein